MTESLAHHLKIACRTGLLVGTAGLLLLYWLLATATRPQDLPFTCEGGLRFLVIMAGCVGVSLLGGVYLSAFLGVDVLGVQRLCGMPSGKPFDGLRPGEHERLRLRWVVGGLGRAAGLGFEVLLTDRRMLAGSSLTSWFLIEVPFERVERVELVTRWGGRTKVRFHLREGSGRRWWDVFLAKPWHRERLVAELRSLGLPVAGGTVDGVPALAAAGSSSALPVVPPTNPPAEPEKMPAPSGAGRVLTAPGHARISIVSAAFTDQRSFIVSAMLAFILVAPAAGLVYSLATGWQPKESWLEIVAGTALIASALGLYLRSRAAELGRLLADGVRVVGRVERCVASGQWVVLRVGYAVRDETITRSVWLPANERTRRLAGRDEVTLAVDALVPSKVVIADLYPR